MKRRIFAALAALALAVPAGAMAQALDPTETYVLAGALLDKPGTAPRGPSTLVLRGGKVAEVRSGFAEAPAGARVIDLRDRFVLPGLIDSHVHLNGRGNPLLARMDASGRDVQDVFVTMQMSARATVEAGFTTARDLGSDPRSIRALRDAVDRGDVVGPGIVNAGQMISVTGGHGDGRNGLREQISDTVELHQINVCDGPDDCRRAVRRQIALGALVIKFAATGGVTSNVAGGLGRQMTPEEMKAIVDTAHAFGRKVTAHSHAMEGTKAALLAGVDSVEHGTFLDDETIRLFKEKDAYLVPTMLAPVATLAQARAGQLRAAAAAKVGEGRSAVPNHERAIRAGVKIAFGTDSGLSVHGDNAREFALLVERGLTPMQAISAATVNAASLLGRADSIGALTPGMDADIIAVKGSPLEDVRRLEQVDFVMHRGAVIKQAGARAPLPMAQPGAHPRN
jgi:imidazolonepropionase-like amidohydrolase